MEWPNLVDSGLFAPTVFRSPLAGSKYNVPVEAERG
jgi:hypothetical protein